MVGTIAAEAARARGMEQQKTMLAGLLKVRTIEDAKRANGD